MPPFGLSGALRAAHTQPGLALFDVLQLPEAEV